jgi:trimeric autotransporter adhesin
MAELPRVTQDFSAGIEGWVASMLAGAEAADRFADSARDAAASAAGEAAASAAAAGVNDLAAASDEAAAAANRATFQFWGWWRILNLSRNALHWIVMGTLEILSTALPAIVAFTAGIAAMIPTFVNIGEHLDALMVAFGDLGGTSDRTGTQVGGLVASFNRLAAAVAPDAYQIFGSIINDLAGKFGIFSKVAQSAANALAGFASKITQDLNGPAGKMLAGFFSEATKDMIQWGQVLGNLGHAFLNIVGSMLGVGKLLLDVLDLLSRAFLALTSNPVVDKLIGVAAAMSALYRYAQLTQKILAFLIPESFIAGLVGYATTIIAIAADLGIMGAAAVVAGDLMDLAFGPVGIAIAAISAALLIWKFTADQAADANERLIKSVEAQTPSVANLTSGIIKLNNAIAAAPKTVAEFTGNLARFGAVTVTQVANRDIPALNAALSKLLGELRNVMTGMNAMNVPAGEVGVNLQFMEAQTELAASQVVKLNEAIDQFVTNAAAPENAFITLAEADLQFSKGLASSTNSLTGKFTVLSAGVKLVGASMDGTNAASLQLRQQFQQAYADVQPLIDALRLAGLTSGQFAEGVRAAIYPLLRVGSTAGYSRQQLILLAQEADGGLTTWREFTRWMHEGGHSMSDLSHIAGLATTSLADLEKAASALNTVMQQAILATFSQAQVKSSGLQGAIQNLQSQTESFNGTVQGPTSSAGAAIIKILEGLGLSAKNAAAEEIIMANNAATLANKLNNLPRNTNLTVTTTYDQVGNPPGGGEGGGGGPGGPLPKITHVHIHNHIAGSILTEQDLARHVVDAMNRQTFRNQSNQLVLAGRGH